MPDLGVCNHKICKCPITGDDKFCSDHCKTAAMKEDVPDTMCGCGHESCGVQRPA